MPVLRRAQHEALRSAPGRHGPGALVLSLLKDGRGASGLRIDQS